MELLFHIRLINVNLGGLSESFMCSWEIREQAFYSNCEARYNFPLQFLYCSFLIQSSMGWNEVRDTHSKTAEFTETERLQSVWSYRKSPRILFLYLRANSKICNGGLSLLIWQI